MGQYQIFQSRFWQLNSTIYYENGTALCWDPAYTPVEIEQVRSALDHFLPDEYFILYTHGDYDHIAGDSRFNGALRVGSLRMEGKADKAEELQQIESVDHEFYIRRDIPLLFPNLDMLITDSGPSRHKLGNVDVHFYPAPGHTPDGLFTIIPSQGLWIAGDYLSDIEFPFVTDLKAYAETLETASRILEDYPIQVMVPGHGKAAFDKTDILDRIKRSENYLESLAGPDPVKPWQESWGPSPFSTFLDKMHEKNIQQVRSQKI